MSETTDLSLKLHPKAFCCSTSSEIELPSWKVDIKAFILTPCNPVHSFSCRRSSDGWRTNLVFGDGWDQRHLGVNIYSRCENLWCAKSFSVCCYGFVRTSTPSVNSRGYAVNIIQLLLSLQVGTVSGGNNELWCNIVQHVPHLIIFRNAWIQWVYLCLKLGWIWDSVTWFYCEGHSPRSS